MLLNGSEVLLSSLSNGNDLICPNCVGREQQVTLPQDQVSNIQITSYIVPEGQRVTLTNIQKKQKTCKHPLQESNGTMCNIW